MAIQQNISTEYGAPATYWKIIKVEFSTENTYTITISGYTDQQARINNSTILKEYSYTVPSNDIPEYFANGFNLHDAYEYLKTKPEFSFGSQDS